MRARLIAVAALLATLGACATQPEQPGRIRVIQGSCDGGRGVNTITVLATGPALQTFTWNNRNQCGDPA